MSGSPGQPPSPTENPFVSRGGLKLRHALEAFRELGVDPAGCWCADLGCSTGGFTDCLLQAGAARVYAVDTAYGELAWKLRQDERVAVVERTNALHAETPGDVVERGGVDLVVIDLGWTPQAKAIPAALRWVRSSGRNPSSVRVPGASPGSPGRVDRVSTGNEPGRAPGPRQEARDISGRVITLIKPHYEVGRFELGPGGVLEPGRAAAVVERVLESMPALGVRALGCVESPVVGGKKGKKGKGRGNKEWLALVEPA